MKWTIEQENLLRELYPIKDASYLADIFGISQQAVRAKASRLNIKRLNNSCAFKGSDKYDSEIKHLPLIRVGNYIGANIPIEHQCHKCSRIWLTSPSHILSGRRCPKCNGNGFRDDMPGILYLIELDIGEEAALYKLGISNKNHPKLRFGKDYVKFNATVCWIIEFDKGKKAKDIEAFLKRKYQNHQYNTGLLKSGNTETFDIYINKPEIEC